ncbi:MAG: hypothetical protein ACJ8EK_16525 [Bradyrhizobium sp.]|jgi:hypothetical protein
MNNLKMEAGKRNSRCSIALYRASRLCLSRMSGMKPLPAMECRGGLRGV